MNRISKDDIRTLVVVIAVCVICVTLVILLNIKSNSDKLEPVKEYNTFFPITNYVNTYINYVSNMNNKAVYEMLDKKYIVDNKIDENNIFDVIEVYPKDISINTSKMEYVKVDNNYIYYVKGKLIQNNMDKKQEIEDNFEIVVITDFDNLSVSIYPIKDKNYKKVIDDIEDINIEKKEFNIIVNSKAITKEQVCVTYLSDYLDKIVNDFDLAYNILSDDMKELYSSKEEYKNHINNIFNNLTTIADKCKLDEIDNSRVYTVIDKNNNRYIFTEESIMNYKVELYENK